MAYTKVSNISPQKSVKYLNKDYNTFKEQLIEFSQVYFPNQWNDFSEGNPGMMFLEMAAYVGDVLSFYTDTQLRENFLLLAQENENLYNLAYTMGYIPKVTSPSSAKLDIFHLVPSILQGGVGGSWNPDYNYALVLSAGSIFSSNGQNFHTDEDIDFSFSSSFDPTDVSVYQYNDVREPQYYLLRKSVRATSGKLKSKTFNVGPAEKYRTLNLFDERIISISSVTDSEGNRWHEVPYLAQDTLFQEVKNNLANDPNYPQYNNQTPYLLKVRKVPKRFVSRVKGPNLIELQFGAGSTDNSDPEILPTPDNIGLGIKDGKSKLDKAYDLSNFLYSKTYGEIPTSTTLTVSYLTGGGLVSNVASNTIINKERINVTAKPEVNQRLSNFCRQSLACTNPEPASGGGGGDSKEELRLNTLANVSSQQRTVTKSDYLVRTLSMPARLGRIAKCYITQDDQITPYTDEINRIPNPLALNLYTLGYNNQKKLTNLNSATKANLSTYLEEYRMLTDAVNIKNAYIINFGIDFVVTTFKNFNNRQVILDCINEIQRYFNIDKWQINQPIIISEVENMLGGVMGVQTVEEVVWKNLNGETLGYSKYRYDLGAATLKKVIYPSLDPSIFELKFPSKNIKGRVTTY